MADLPDTEVKIKLTSDLSGGVQTREELYKLKQYSKQLDRESGLKFGSLGKAMEGVSRVANKLKSALAGFGAIAAVIALIDTIGKLKEAFGSATNEAVKLAKARREAERKKDVDALADAYRKLEESISAAADANSRQNELIDQQVRQQRELADMQLKLAEQIELDSVDSESETAELEREKIRAKYSARRGEAEANAKMDDITFEQSRLNKEADVAEGKAKEYRGLAKGYDEQIGNVDKLIADAKAKSVSENERDEGSWYGMFGKSIKDILSLNWGRIGDTRTEAGDEVRKDAEQRVKELEAEKKQLEKEREDLLKKAKSEDATAKFARDKSELTGQRLQALEIGSQLAIETGNSAREKAATALSDKQREIASARAIVSSAPYMKRKFADEQERAQSRIKGATAKRDKEAEDARRAEEALKSFDAANASRPNATGVQARRARLEETVRREAEEARAAETEYRRTESEVSKVLSRLTEQMKKFNSDLQKSESRIKSASENGEG